MKSRESIYRKLERMFQNHITFSSAEELEQFFENDINFVDKEITEKERNALIKRILDSICEKQNFLSAKEVIHCNITLGFDAIASLCHNQISFPLTYLKIEATRLKKSLTIVLQILCEIEDHLEKLQQSYVICHLPKLFSLYVNGALSKEAITFIFEKMPSYEERMQLLGKIPMTGFGLQTRMESDIPIPSTIVVNPFARMIMNRISIKESIGRIISSYEEELPTFIQYLNSIDFEADERTKINLNLFLKAVKDIMKIKVQEEKSLSLIPGQQSLY